MSARAGSAGLLSAEGWTRLRRSGWTRSGPALTGADAVLVSLHGAMGADGELDPEGNLLEADPAGWSGREFRSSSRSTCTAS